MVEDRVMDKLRKLKLHVDNARDSANQNEVDNALNLFLAYAAKYQVDISLLDNETSANKAAHRRISFKNPHAKDKGRLMSAIVRAYGGCSVILDNDVWHYFAYQTDLDLADKMFDLLFDNGLRELAVASRNTTQSGRSFTTAFWAGYVSVLSRRLSDARNGALAESTSGAALVLAKRGDEAQDLKNTTYKRLRHGPARNIYSGSGYAAGAIAGKNAQLFSEVE